MKMTSVRKEEEHNEKDFSYFVYCSIGVQFGWPLDWYHPCPAENL
jgi:hypothetical protein